jgi:thymidylate kinase
LVAPPEILYKRKPEHSLDFFEKCYNDYLKLSKEFNIHLIDTSKYSEDEVVEIIINNLK